MNRTITLSADAKFGYGGKQFVARIKGRDPKFTFDREFLGRKEGKRGESTSIVVDTPGMYQERDIDSKGRATDTSYVVTELPGVGLIKYPLDHDEAMALAKELDGNISAWPEIARTYIIGELKRLIAAGENKPDAQLSRSCAITGAPPQLMHDRLIARRAMLAELTGTPQGALDLDGGPTDPSYARRALLDERAQLIARLAQIEVELGHV